MVLPHFDHWPDKGALRGSALAVEPSLQRGGQMVVSAHHVSLNWILSASLYRPSIAWAEQHRLPWLPRVPFSRLSTRRASLRNWTLLITQLRALPPRLSAAVGAESDSCVVTPFSYVQSVSTRSFPPPSVAS